jgi:hypothetical protein
MYVYVLYIYSLVYNYIDGKKKLVPCQCSPIPCGLIGVDVRPTASEPCGVVAEVTSCAQGPRPVLQGVAVWDSHGIFRIEKSSILRTWNLNSCQFFDFFKSYFHWIYVNIV